MAELGEFEKAHIVAYAITSVLNDANQKLQAIKAFRNVCPNRLVPASSGDWYSLAYWIMLDSLVLDITSLLDNAKFLKKKKEETNCSFDELKFILNCSDENRKKYHRVIVGIEALLKNYKGLIPENLRNKRIAHKDLNELFNWNHYDIKIDEITKFLVDGYKIASDTLELTIGAIIQVNSFDFLKQKYEESLKKPLNE